MKTPPERLAEGLRALGLELAEAQRERLVAYLELLQRWNRAYNLTAVRDPAAMVDRHLLDSLAIAPYLPPGALLDLGSGGGLPGVPLAIAEPRRPITLLDRSGKKVRFLRQCRLELGLEGVEVVQGDASAGGEARFDVVTARAVAPLAALVPMAASRLRAGGVLLAHKGERVGEEIAELPEGVAAALERHELPAAGGAGRSILVRYRRD